MEYIKNQKYSFKVKGTRRSGSNLYYIIDVNGWESYVKAYEFQKNNPPSEIICICKGDSKNAGEEGSPSFMQDIAALISQLYKVGDTGEFRVKSQQNNRGYYDVVDENGFCFRLTRFGSEKLFTNQSVYCRITYINLVRVEMELISSKRNEGIPLYTLDRLVAFDTERHVHPLFIKTLLMRLPAFVEMRKSLQTGNPLWVIKAIETFDASMASWLLTDMSYKRELLRSFISICVNLLENSDFLRQATDHEKTEYQNLVSSVIMRAEDYLEAITLVETDRDRELIEDTLNRLMKSGYLYNPERRMRMTMCIFSLRRKSMRTFIRQIFNIIKQRHSGPNFMNLFSKACIQMLDIFLRTAEESNALMATTWDRVSIQEIVEALAIQLLLTTASDTGHQNLSIYKSMLYRYASLLVTVDENINALTMKAFDALFGQFSPQLEFGWDDLDNITLLCSKLATRRMPVSAATDIKIFEGNNALLKIDSHVLKLMPGNYSDSMKNVLPSNIFQTTPVQIFLDGKLSEKPAGNSIQQYQRMWKEIETSLFAPPVHASRPRVHSCVPDVGDEVLVRVVGPVENSFEFQCRIEDPLITGSGTIIPQGQIVSYPVRPSIDCFRDQESGKPFLLPARVEGVDSLGRCTFSMRGGIARFNFETLDREREYLAQVTRVDDRQYLCISEDGFTLFIPRDKASTELFRGDFILVDIVKIYPDGNIQGALTALSDDSFTRVRAFSNLLEDYAQGRVYDPEQSETASDDDKDVTTVLQPQYLRELVWVTDREGMLQKSQAATYNYMAIARIFCLMLEDSEKAEYYDRRMDLVMALNEFGESGRIDDATLDSLLMENKEVIANYPDIAHRLTQLRIVNQLDNPRETDFLWAQANQTDNKHLGALAQLVLAHNLLGGNNAFLLRKELKKKIFRLLDLSVPVPESAFVAAEDQFTELKTSIVYPATKGSNMYANERQQIEEIMKIVCAFLNARGGTLYVGVNDTGNAVGLHNDFCYFNNGHPDYDLIHVKDVFDRRVRDNIHASLGVIANDLVSSSFEQVDEHWIYRLDVNPSSEIIKLDNVAYVRQGTSKHVIPTEKIAQFKKLRQRRDFGMTGMLDEV